MRLRNVLKRVSTGPFRTSSCKPLVAAANTTRAMPLEPTANRAKARPASRVDLPAASADQAVDLVARTAGQAADSEDGADEAAAVREAVLPVASAVPVEAPAALA